MSGTARIREIMGEVRALAAEYRALTGKPLGVTGEVAEYHAATLIGLDLAPAREPGHDAIHPATGARIQIKGRVVLQGSKPGQRLGKIKQDAQCDIVMLVLMNEALEPTEILEAPIAAVRDELAKPGSQARARGALGIRAFRRAAKTVWSAP